MCPNAGDHGRFQLGALVPPCWNRQMLQCSQAPGGGCTQGLSQDSKRTLEYLGALSEITGPPALCRG